MTEVHGDHPWGPFLLGTVQLGLAYGVANRTGQPSERQAFAILDAAVAGGVSALDTAHAYGAAEAVIGAWLRRAAPRPRIVTKIPALNGGGPVAAEAALRQSLARLGIQQVDALLLHRGSDWEAAGVADWMAGIRAAGLATQIGVSVYSPDEISDDPRIDLVQLPANALSQSALLSPRLRAMTARGANVHVRSVFAQGALLADPTALPAALQPARGHLTGFRRLADERGIDPAALAIAAVRQLQPGCSLVLGAETVEQVAGLLAAARASVPPTAVAEAIALGRDAPADLLDPRRWHTSPTTEVPA